MALRKINLKKAPGFDFMNPIWLENKLFRKDWINFMIDIINQKKPTPIYINTARLVFLPKKIGELEYSDLRPIMVQPMFIRVLEQIILGHLKQIGFQQNHLS